MINVTQATYSRYETGEIDIPVSILIRLAEFYNTSVDYLVGITDIKTAYKSLNDRLQNHSSQARHHIEIR